MKYLKIFLQIGLLLTSIISCSKTDELINVYSPDKHINFELNLDKQTNSSIVYSVKYDTSYIAINSLFGFVFNDTINVSKNWEIGDIKTSSVKQSWETVYGERSSIPDNYEKVEVFLEQTKEPFLQLIITARVYNEGIAFKYTILEQKALNCFEITDELTEFSFLNDHKAWITYKAQGKYDETKLSKIEMGCERPLTLEINDSLFVALGEAALVNSARMKFDKTIEKPHTLNTSLSGSIKDSLPYTSAWRYIMIGDWP